MTIRRSKLFNSSTKKNFKKRVKQIREDNMTLLPYQQSCLIYAARYAHTRNTGAAYQVVSAILYNWDNLSKDVKKQLKMEAMYATCNMEDWNILINKEV